MCARQSAASLSCPSCRAAASRDVHSASCYVEFRLPGQVHYGQVQGHRGGAEGFEPLRAPGIHGALTPDPDGGTRNHGAVVAQLGPVGQQALQGRKHGIAQLKTVPVRRLRFAHEPVPRPKIPARAQQEHAGRAGFTLHDFPHGAGVVGTDERIVPGQGRRVAAIVDEGGDQPAFPVAGAGDHDRVVGGPVGVGPNGVQLVFFVPVVAVVRQVAPAESEGQVDRLNGVPGR